MVDGARRAIGGPDEGMVAMAYGSKLFSKERDSESSGPGWYKIPSNRFTQLRINSAPYMILT